MFRVTLFLSAAALAAAGCQSGANARLDKISASLDSMDKRLASIEKTLLSGERSSITKVQTPEKGSAKGPDYEKLALIKKLPPGATEAQIREYIDAIMSASKGQNTHTSSDPQIAMLKMIPSERWELLLPYIRGSEDFYITTVICGLIPESDKDKVIGMLPERPFLLDTVIKNGWIPDAKESILKSIEKKPSGFFSLNYAPAMPFLAETPEGRQRLLKCFTTQVHCFFLYDTLRQYDDIDMTAAVDTAWNNLKSEPGKWFAMNYAKAAAGRGNKDALDYLIQYRLSNKNISGDNIAGLQIITRLTGQSLDPDTLEAWYEESKDQLIFDPAKRRFVVRGKVPEAGK
jgi:hypothetical protein